MKISLLITLSYALGAPAPDTPGVLSVPIHREKTQSLRRRGAFLEPLDNRVYSYIAHFELGSNKQPISAAIDTGSSDLWVYTSYSGAEQGYNPESSKTSRNLGIPFSIQYVSGSADGDFYTDDVTIGGATVKDFQFGAVSNLEESSSEGVFGIGFSSNEAGHQHYPNFPDQLKAQGIIERKAYSLYLDSKNAESGNVLFGGVDKAKYEGELSVFDFGSTYEFIAPFTVAGHSGAAVLDSGTSLTYVDVETFEAIARNYPYLRRDPSGLFVASGRPTNIQPLVWNIGGATITVPGSELFIENGGLYVFAIVPNTESSGINLIGDSTLRSAYVVYDLDGYQGAIAQAKYTSDSNVVALKGGLDTI